MRTWCRALLFVSTILLFLSAVFWVNLQDIKTKIILGVPLYLNDEEFHCGYTEKQMKLNILQEEIDRIKSGAEK